MKTRGVLLVIGVGVAAGAFALGVTIGTEITADELRAVEAAEEANNRAIVDHRIRNELIHDCLVRGVESIRADMAVIVQRVQDGSLLEPGGAPVVIEDIDCPAPLSEDELRDLATHPPEDQ